MGRYRSHSRSYSPRRSRSPIRQQKRYDEPRERYRGGSRSYRDRRSPGSSGLLVRNISLDARPEDLRIPFERFGPVKDVYLPKNYYTGEPRGFGFVKFRNPDDAAEAKQQMNHQVIGGREITIVFAEENRKTPQDMRMSSRISGRYGGGYRRRTPPRSPRRRYHSRSLSPSPVRRASRYGFYPLKRGRDHGRRDDYSRSQSISRSHSRSHTPRDERNQRSNRRSPSPRENGRTPQDEKDYGSDQKSPSPRGNGQSRSRSRSYSPR